MADRAYGRNYGRVPDELLWDQRASERACRLYAALTRYAQQRDRVVPPRPELASRLGWSLDKLDRTVKELEQLGAVHVERHRGVKGESRTRESTYWLDGHRPTDPGRKNAASPSRRSAASPGRKDAAIDSRKDAATSLEERTSPNGDGATHSELRADRRADTIVGQCIDALGYTPVERGAFAKIVTEAWTTASSPDVVLRGVREWGPTGEPVSYLTGRIGQLDRAARTRTRKHAAAVQIRHDGEHDPDCWCYQIPDDQRAKVKLGDLRAAAGLPVEDAAVEGGTP